MISRAIDLYLYDRVFVPLYEWLWKRFGWGNLTLAKWCIWIGSSLMLTALGLLLTLQVEEVTNHIRTHQYVLGAMILVEAWLTYKFLRSVIEREANLERDMLAQSLPPNLRDGQRQDVSLRRLFVFAFLFFSILLPENFFAESHKFLALPDSVRVISLFFVLIGCYFAAVPPRPPRRQERRVQATAAVPVKA